MTRHIIVTRHSDHQIIERVHVWDSSGLVRNHYGFHLSLTLLDLFKDLRSLFRGDDTT